MNAIVRPRDHLSGSKPSHHPYTHIIHTLFASQGLDSFQTRPSRGSNVQSVSSSTCVLFVHGPLNVKWIYESLLQFLMDSDNSTSPRRSFERIFHLNRGIEESRTLDHGLVFFHGITTSSNVAAVLMGVDSIRFKIFQPGTRSLIVFS